MSVDYISAVNTLVDVYPQYEKTLADMQRKKPFNYEDFTALNTYLLFAKNGCYRELHSFSKRIRLIKDAEPLLDLAKKMHQVAAPIILLCKEGEKLCEERKSNPSRGPAIKHWLAIYLSDLNLAIFQLHLVDKNDPTAGQEVVEKIKEAIGKICYFQGVIEKMPPEKKSESLRQIHQICEQRLNQIDSTGRLRKELNKSSLEEFKVYIPTLLNLGGGIGANLVMMKIFDLMRSSIGDESIYIASMTLYAIQLSHSIQSRTLLYSCLSAISLYVSTSNLYYRAYPS